MNEQELAEWVKAFNERLDRDIRRAEENSRLYRLLAIAAVALMLLAGFALGLTQ